MKNNLSVLLTGASGAIGLEVLKQLYSTKNFDITVFDLKTSQSVKSLSPFRGKVKIIYGEISNEEGVNQVCDK